MFGRVTAAAHAAVTRIRPAGAPVGSPRRLVSALLAAAIVSILAGGATAAAGLDYATEVRSSLPAPRSAATTPVNRVSRPGAESPPPTAITIPSIGVSAPVDAVGLLDDGTVAVPPDTTRTGWYTGLESPGEAGAAVIVGHLDSRTGPGVFFRVPQLRPGDTIVVTLADGRAVRFVVDRTEQYVKERFPTIAVYAPTARSTLRLVTCAGTFDRASRHYRDNVVVYASEAP